jgi:hypothetical protein
MNCFFEYCRFNDHGVVGLKAYEFATAENG